MPATKPSEMVDLVARAICDKHGFYRWDDPAFPAQAEREGDLGPSDYRALARAAITAMREPTEAMHEAGDVIISDGEGFPHDKPLPTLRNAYRAMIDAALKE